MRLGVKSTSILISLSIAVIYTAVLYFSMDMSDPHLILSFAVLFIVSLIITYTYLEIFVFKEIGKVHELFRRFSEGKDIEPLLKEGSSKFFNEPIKQLNEDLAQYAASKQDEIDDLKKMETFRREFMADVSHELKTPIFSAQGFIHTLIDGAIDDKKVRLSFLHKAANNLDGLNVLVQDLLSISQIEAGEVIMDFYVFDIVDTVKNIFDQLEETANEKKVKLSFDKKFIEQPVYVHGDSRRIEQVMRNLIANGIAYNNKDKGKVQVGFEIRSNKVKIFIKDDGMGIPPEDKNRIFERFYRVEKSRTKIKGGTGLGLSIVKHIVEAHDSKVEVTSTVDKGSTFSFVLKRGSRSL